jgi:hypothetical protein
VLYGSGTKWCITRLEDWKTYSTTHNIYIAISKYLEKDNPFYKVALTVDDFGLKIYWDAENNDDIRIPKSIKESENLFKKFEFDTEEKQIDAIKQHSGRLIQYFENPSEKVQFEAVKNDSSSIHFIKNPTDKVKEYVKNNSVKSN